MSKFAGWTTEEEKAVVSVWEKTMRALPDAGIEFAVAWFTSHPDSQTRFRLFADLSIEELRTNSRLAAHSAKILGNINSLIVCRSKAGAVQELLNDLKRDHADRYVTSEDHQAFAKSLVQFLTKTFGKSLMNEAAVSGFTKLLNLIGEYTVSVKRE